MGARSWFIGTVVGACAAALPAAATATPVAIANAPRVAAAPPGSGSASSAGWASSNWSGYAVTGSGFTSVSGSWAVPAVSPTKGNTYSSSWVGIDGFNNSNLIQTGTEQDYVNGAPRYSAWWEILPAPETVIPSLTVKPGDHIAATITSGPQWTITITDTTTGASFTTQQAYSGAATSAEWIEEAPQVGGRVATLAHYGGTQFDSGTVNGANPALVASEGGVMVQHRAQVSTPSAPDLDADGFAVEYGATAPAAPAS
jgi:peptidase A4-like protein